MQLLMAAPAGMQKQGVVWGLEARTPPSGLQLCLVSGLAGLSVFGWAFWASVNAQLALLRSPSPVLGTNRLL